MDVLDAILGQALVHAVEERPQESTHHSHHDEKGQVHRRPQVAVLISVWALVRKRFHHGVQLMQRKNIQWCTDSNIRRY